ncbi:hypothetical protein D3C71_1723430 [compost metagenome]
MVGLPNLEEGLIRMAIYFDGMGHMVSDTSIEELHEFAQKLGLKKTWFQNKGTDKHWIPHYDLTTYNARRRAKAAGAIEVFGTEVVGILRNAPYKDRRQDYLGEGMS